MADMNKSTADTTFEDDEEASGSDAYEPRGMEPKMRHCLRCRTAFLSEWSGERICRKCKSTIAWRQGWT